MRKLIVTAAVLGAGFALGVVVVGVPIAVRAGVGGDAVINGDTNGDGELDISDAVFLLVHLFKSGPEPVACADSPELVGRVATLESQVVSLERNGASALQEIENLRSRVDKTEPAPLFASTNLVVNSDGSSLPAPAGLQSGQFTKEWGNPSYTVIKGGELVRNGEVVAGNAPATGIRFETDHESTLVLEVDY